MGHRRVNIDPLTHEHVPPRYLENLKEYKYSGSDLSIVGNLIMQPYWNAVVKLVPMWVAPNVITMTGFLVSVSSTLLVLWYYFQCAANLQSWLPAAGYNNSAVFDALEWTRQGVTAEQPIPSWVWLYCAFALFAYQTLDAIDGKQARRTKSGSPMGELFDHGCDAFFTPLLQVNICLAIGMEVFTRFHFFLLITTGLLLSIWEQFSTGTLDLGYINGPTDGILIVVAIFLATGFYGSDIWATPIASWIPLDSALSATMEAYHPVLGVLVEQIRTLTAGGGLLAFVSITSVFTFVSNILHVFLRRRVRGDALLVLIPNAAVLALYVLLYRLRPGLVESFPFVVELSYGFLASYTATRLTVARLCQMPYRPVSVFFTLSFVVALLSVGSVWLPQFLQSEASASYTFLHQLAAVEQVQRVMSLFARNDVSGWSMVAVVAVGVMQYLHLIVSVFRQLSHFLKIHVFSIKKRV